MSRWTNEEVEILSLYYPTEGKDVFPRLSDKTLPSIFWKAGKLGLICSKVPWNKGISMSDALKEKLRLSHLGKKRSAASIAKGVATRKARGIRSGMLGKKQSEISKEKTRQAMLGHVWKEGTLKRRSEGMKRAWADPERKEKWLASLGSEECRGKRSKAQKGKPKPGTSARMKEYWKDPEFREKQEEIKKTLWKNPEYRKSQVDRVSGAKSPFWRGGGGKAPYSDGWTNSLKESIRERDNHICQACGISQDDLDYKLHVHHIDGEKSNLDPSNLIALCRRCHIKTRWNTPHWERHFKETNSSRILRSN